MGNIVDIYLNFDNLNYEFIDNIKNLNSNVNIKILNYKSIKLKDEDCFIDISNGIQIDTELDNFKITNPNVRIVIRDCSRDWYSTPLINYDNVYVVKDWTDAFKILEYFLKNPDFIWRCYQ